MQEDNVMKFLIVARQQIAMQQLVWPWPKSMSAKPSSGLRRPRPFSVFVFGLSLSIVPAILGGKKLFAQTRPPQNTRPAQQNTEVNPIQQPPAAAEVIALRPPAVPAPIGDANRSPSEAKVSWDDRGLEIEASNSSLNQILLRVADDTGAKLEGLTQDQRVFGSYGPGPASEVLWKLLDGSGYNVLMIGGPGTDTPIEIVLSARSPASPQAVNNQNRSEQSNPEPPPNHPPEPPRLEPVQNPFGNGDPPRDPLQFMQEILQRQQKIDQQQEQQQENNSHH
jgi:hypothetical protein